MLRYAKYVKRDLRIRKETHKRDMYTERDLLTLSWCSGRWGVQSGDASTCTSRADPTFEERAPVSRNTHRPSLRAAHARYRAGRCNALQQSATHCDTLQQTATHCNTLRRTATHCSTLQHIATHCDTRQHAATHGNTLQPSTEQHAGAMEQMRIKKRIHRRRTEETYERDILKRRTKETYKRDI